MFRVFELIIDDGSNVFKVYETAKNKSEAEKSAQGNGEIVRIKDVTDEYPISTERLQNVLDSNFGKVESHIICQMVAKLVKK